MKSFASAFFALVFLKGHFVFATYSPETRARAIQMVKKGKKFSETARKLGVNPKSVRNWVRDEEKRVGQLIVEPIRRCTPETRARAIQLVRETGSIIEAARELNISWPTVNKCIRDEEQRTGRVIERRGKVVFQYPPETRARAIQLVKETGNISKAARELDISRPTISRWIQDEEQRTGRIIEIKDGAYSPATRIRAIELVRETGNISEAARELNISRLTISQWVRNREQRTGEVIRRRGHLTETCHSAASSLLQTEHNEL